MTVQDGSGAEARPAKGDTAVSIDTAPAAEGLVSNNAAVSAPPPVPHLAEQTTRSRKKKAVAAKPKAASSPKTTKTAGRSSRTASKPEKLVCRYCGSDDLAPSFKQRRDARCRECFKQRYGSAAKDKKTKPVLKAKTTK
jgi:hypothetical protein